MNYPTNIILNKIWCKFKTYTKKLNTKKLLLQNSTVIFICSKSARPAWLLFTQFNIELRIILSTITYKITNLSMRKNSPLKTVKTFNIRTASKTTRIYLNQIHSKVYI